ncbi:hypothetical protein [Melissococcus plutonius]|nr:hypothetical protein [Melissococcus plutonius]MBB5177462.1 hypothetical protein [Melissococcus plutonius]
MLTKEMASIVLECLTTEKALYTKIYMCEKLQTGNSEIASIMIPYLGKIGTNQYKHLPEKSSKKRSYPLPRDIIARTLSKMNSQIVYVLTEKLEQKEMPEEQLSERIDAIGYIVFYDSTINRKRIYQNIIKTMEKHQKNNLITWKFLTCLSAFPQSIDILEDYCYHSKLKILQLEAERSLNLILRRRNEKLIDY